MFGDKTLIGHYNISLDEKARMIMPANLNSEKEDVLALLYEQKIDCYKLYHIDTIREYFEQLYNKILNAKSDNELEMAKMEFYKFSKSIIKECVVDSQKRVSLGDSFKPHEKLLLYGAYNHVVLEKTKNK